MRKRQLGSLAAIFAALFSLLVDAAPVDFKEQARAFVGHLDREEYQKAVELFDPTMRTSLPASQLQRVWKSTLATHGKLHSLGDSLQFEQAGYQIVLQTCIFEKARLDAKLVFDAQGRIAGLWFLPTRDSEQSPPAYLKQGERVEQQIKFGHPEWELPGILTLPKGDGPFSAVVFLHGSGPQDRDETIGPNKPFRDLAVGLAAHQIASLRYDKRTKVHGSRMSPAEVTLEQEVIEDALRAVSFLRQVKTVDRNKVFLLGHSLGGMLAPEIASRDKQIAGVIIMAGNTRPLEQSLLEQTEYVCLLDGRIDETEKQKLEEIRQGTQAVKAHQLGEHELFFYAPGSYWYQLRKIDPVETASRLTQPMLVLQGARDYQVTVEDFEGWKKGLAAKKGVTFTLYPELNHLFMKGKGKSTPLEYEQPGHVDEQVIEDVATWVLITSAGK